MKRGSITLYVSLLLPLLIAVVTASIFSVKVQADRTQLANGMDQALYSLLAQYDRDMLAKYDLFFLDGSCGGTGLHAEKLAERLRRYMQEILKPAEGSLLPGASNMIDLSLAELAFTEMSLATDMQGRVFEAQAIAFMRERCGLQAVSRLLKVDEEIKQQTPSGEAEEIRRAWEAEREGVLAAAQEDEVPASADGEVMAALRQLWQKPLLEAALPKTLALSSKEISLSSLPSRRALQHGFGVTELAGTDFGVTDVLLYKEYLMRHFGNVTTPVEEGGLSYQAEYLIAGQKSDAENLAAVLARILLLREGVNLVFLVSDSEKRSEAKVLAEAIAALLLSPEAAPAIEVVLLGAWAYAESLIDLHALLLGKRVAPVKSAESWQLGLADLPKFAGGGADALIKEAEPGLAYEDFLRLFLLPMREESLNMRALDMIENTVRAGGRPNFSVDTQIYMLSFSVTALAEGQIELRGEKKYSYADLA